MDTEPVLEAAWEVAIGVSVPEPEGAGVEARGVRVAEANGVVG